LFGGGPLVNLPITIQNNFAVPTAVAIGVDPQARLRMPPTDGKTTLRYQTRQTLFNIQPLRIDHV
jgi:hypothetical protein